MNINNRAQIYKLFIQMRGMFSPHGVIIRLVFGTLFLICSQNQPYDDPLGSKHVAELIFYKVVFDGY